MQIEYYLAHACNNTFVLFDQIGDLPTPFFWKQAHAVLLKEKRDDALILTEEFRTKDALFVKMHVLGEDGRFGEFCGNGARSVAAYLFAKYPRYQEFYIVTKRGTYPLLSFGKGIYAAHLPAVQFGKSKVKTIPYAEILEPHLAVEGDLSDHDLFVLGRHLNQKDELFPQGINVNAWSVLCNNVISVKTYERGVQRLTKSCGTGSSVCAALHLQGPGKVIVKTPGGALLIRIHEDRTELIGAAHCEERPLSSGSDQEDLEYLFL